MERKIGEIFEYNGIRFRVEKETGGCFGCYFCGGNCTSIKPLRGECQKANRSDIGVIFKKVEDMEGRTIKLTLEKAKEFYKKGGEFKDLALSAFTVEELTHKELPKTWKEYKENWAEREKGIRLGDMSEVELDKIKISKDITSAHNALLALHLLRDCYRQGWEPNYADCTLKYFLSKGSDRCISVDWCRAVDHFLTFQTEEVAKEFLDNFKELIFKALDLL